MRWVLEDAAEAIGMYIDGTSMEDIGEKFGVSWMTVKKLLEHNGIEIRTIGRGSKILSEEEEKELCRKYLGGYSAGYLAKEYGMSEKRVRKYLSKNRVFKNK